MDSSGRIQAVSKFLLESPPGEINDVLNDVRNIIADDDSLQQGIAPALREYNLAQFITVDVPGTDHQSIISKIALVGNPSDDENTSERFLDPRSNTTFKFDHLTLEASDPQPHEPDDASEPFRAALEASVHAYLSSHFSDGTAAVFSYQGSPTVFIIQIIANKYNPSNFWSGRWRSEYEVNLESRLMQGSIAVNVHYYEQGNVQLSANHEVSLPLPPTILQSSPTPSAAKVLALVESEEGEYQISLTETYQGMSEKTYKSLRRALPMTRSKMDWDKVLGYKLGAELSAGKGGFS
ncbi:F-actin-capping protein subunit alpha [Thelephora terrestris]|uniref:F-actin-capping protein subunit alpha n=1 Tax=Thelephora terrestris TaxID=56493 RepID=A0A9P6H402_9AGAM|nr:F-actin-capping protein subunit alpha [Thelephora terrestris]